METADLLVVGGGITGAGVARLAARNGLSVELVERADLASGASGASSHMLHGGLRYLEHGHLHMVREALQERAAVLRMAGPLATIQRFLVPCRRGARVPAWKLRAGLALYDGLAGRHVLERHGWVGAREALALEPALDPHDLIGAGLYSDAVVDDARLTVAVTRDAAAHGARISTWTEVEDLRHAGDDLEVRLHDRLDGAGRALRARCVANATGAWSDAVRARLLAALGGGAPGPARLGPSRGTHLVCPRLTRHALLLLAGSDGRVFFVIPFGNRALIGTTEVAVPSPPGERDFAADAAEIGYLAREWRRALPGCAAARPIAVFSGMRPLLRSGTRVGAAPREHRVIADGRILTIAGGKLTTFRVMARDTVRAALRALGRRADVADAEEPLPAPFEAAGSHEDLGAFAVREEFARRLEDVLRRRTRAWLAADRGRGMAPAVAAAMAACLGWSAERAAEERASWERTIAAEERALEAAREDA